MTNTTDTNQASEDELQRYHLSSCAKYETLRGIYPNDRRLTGDPCSCGIEALIRTEKLKLLAEIDKSMPTVEQLTTKYGYHMPEKQYGYKLALHDIREELTKLEAEL